MEKIIKKIILIVSLLVSCHSVFPQKDDDKLIIEGFIEGDHISYFNKFSDSTIDVRNQSTLQIKLSKKLSERTGFFSSTEFREDFSDEDRSRVFGEEYYFNFTKKKWDFKLGKQRIYWGRADGINFSNNINPSDYSDFLDVEDEELGVLAGNIKYNFKNNFFFQTIILPAYRTSRLPSQQSVWQYNLPTSVEIMGTTLPAIYQFSEDFIPDVDGGIQYAFKLDGSLNSIDLSLGFYSGFSDLPELVINPTNVASNNVTLTVQKVYIPWNVISFDFATYFKSIGFRGEFGYFITKGRGAELADSEENYLQYSLGLDYLLPIGNTNLLLLAEWMHEWVPSGRKYSTSSLNHIFQKSLLVRTELKVRDKLSMAFQAIYDFKNTDYYLQPKVTYAVIDDVLVSLLSDIIGANGEGVLGLYERNDRTQLKITYNF